MGETIKLTAGDGHELDAYLARPSGPAKAGLVVIQEIFGVNSHIRSICDGLAGAGYLACAPAMFDRQEPGFESGYTPPEVERARGFVADMNWEAMMLDTRAAVEAVRSAGPVGIVGFCMGGSVAYLAAVRIPELSAAVAYYGGRIVRFADEKPACPVQMHFGDRDKSVPMADVEAIRQKRPDTEVHVYAGAEHGFNCDQRASYDPDSASLAWQRTMAFFEANLKG